MSVEENNDRSTKLVKLEGTMEHYITDCTIKSNYDDSWETYALDSNSTYFANESLQGTSDNCSSTDTKFEAAEGSTIGTDDGISILKTGHLEIGEVTKIPDSQLVKHEIDSNSLLTNEATNEKFQLGAIKKECEPLQKRKDHSNGGIHNASAGITAKAQVRVKAYPCRFCGERLSTAETLKEHTWIHTKEKPRKCEFCGKCFRQQRQLVRHRLSHKGERPHECEFCGKGFVTPYYLKRHLKTHSGERPYKCETCAKAFSESYQLKTHTIRVHSQETPYPCKFCDKRFRASCDLKEHEIIHNDGQQYSCKFCNKQFGRPSSLKSHLKIHIDVKLYECNICGKSFTQAGYLNNHKLSLHYGDKTYIRCDICGESITFKDLKSHKTNHVKNPKETYILS